MTLQIITPDRFQTTPWKNGGGITHEIARAQSGDRMIWRVSVAEVDTDGPFSRFDGMMRILTVIEGAGLILASPEGDIAAMPLIPVRFSGERAVDGRRIAGPVRDLNVIFDPDLVEASVAYLTTAEGCAPQAAAWRSFALYCLRGEIGFGPAGIAREKSAALFTEPPPGLQFSPGAEALLITLDRRPVD